MGVGMGVAVGVGDAVGNGVGMAVGATVGEGSRMNISRVTPEADEVALTVGVGTMVGG